MNRPDRWYIAGPMRGKPNYNYAAFDHARTILDAYTPEGTVIVSPADEDRMEGVVSETEDGTVTLTDRFDIQATLRKDINLVMGGTHLLLLPGWSQSEGARAEAMAAAATGIIIGLFKDDNVYGPVDPSSVLEAIRNPVDQFWDEIEERFTEHNDTDYKLYKGLA